MNGPAAFPTQYAMSMIAFVVTRFVWPAVTFESHESESTKPVMLIPAAQSVSLPSWIFRTWEAHP